MCSEQRFESMAYVDHMDEAPVIGTIERRPPMTSDSSPAQRRPVTSERNAGLAAEARQRP